MTGAEPGSGEASDAAAFHESQPPSGTFRVAWGLVAVIIVGIAAWTILTAWDSASLVGKAVLLVMLALGIAAVGLVAIYRVDVAVADGTLFLSVPPVFRERHEVASLSDVRVVQTESVWQYGGYGMRWFEGGRAYVGTARTGVQFVLPDGKERVVTSHRPVELAEALGA